MKQYLQASSEFKDEFNKYIEGADKILITSHKNPDDDSIGSVLSMYLNLKKLFPKKEIDIIYSTPIDDRWEYFESFDKVKTVDDIANVVQNYNLVIFLDHCQYHLSSENPEKISKQGFKSIAIDHHKNTPDEYNLLLHDSNACSATELVYSIFDLEKVEKRLAEVYLLGILGDSGYLEFIKPSQSYIFSVVQKLVNEGQVNISELRLKTAGISERLFQVIQEFIKNMTIKKIGDWPKMTLSFISRDFIENNNFTDLETSGGAAVFISQFSRAIKGVDWGMVLKPQANGEVSVSLRSNPGSINTSRMMIGFGIGGGHERAAGGTLKEDGQTLDSKEALNKITNWMETNQPTLS